MTSLPYSSSATVHARSCALGGLQSARFVQRKYFYTADRFTAKLKYIGPVSSLLIANAGTRKAALLILDVLDLLGHPFPPRMLVLQVARLLSECAAFASSGRRLSLAGSGRFRFVVDLDCYPVGTPEIARAFDTHVGGHDAETRAYQGCSGGIGLLSGCLRQAERL